MPTPNFEDGEKCIELNDVRYNDGETFRMTPDMRSWRHEIRSIINEILNYPSLFNTRLEKKWQFPDKAVYNGPWFTFSFEESDIGIMDMRIFFDDNGQHHFALHTVQGVPRGEEKAKKFKEEVCSPLEGITTHAIGAVAHRINRGAEMYLVDPQNEGARLQGIRDRFFKTEQEKIASQGLLRLNGRSTFRGGGGYVAYGLNKNRKRVQSLLNQ